MFSNYACRQGPGQAHFEVARWPPSGRRAAARVLLGRGVWGPSNFGQLSVVPNCHSLSPDLLPLCYRHATVRFQNICWPQGGDWNETGRRLSVLVGCRTRICGPQGPWMKNLVYPPYKIVVVAFLIAPQRIRDLPSPNWDGGHVEMNEDSSCCWLSCCLIGWLYWGLTPL